MSSFGMVVKMLETTRMIEHLGAFHFLHPWWLLVLLVLPLWLWWVRSVSTSRHALSRLVDTKLLPYVLHEGVTHRRMAWILLSLGWFLGVLALAGPSWSRVTKHLYAKRDAQVLAISLSQQMLARDVAPSRINQARYKAHDLLKANRDGWNALIGYAGASFVVAPLTSDAHSLSNLLDAMTPDIMPVDGNDAASAITQGAGLIHAAGIHTGLLVLITNTADKAAQEAARKARAGGVRISVLGVGKSQGVPVPLTNGHFLDDAQGNMLLSRRDDAALTALAAAGGGRYVPMRDDGSDIVAIHQELTRDYQHVSMVAKRQSDVWQDRGPWLLLPLLLVVAAGFRRGWLLLLPVLICPLVISMPLRAMGHHFGWKDLWQRRDQQASLALHAGHPAEAARLADTPTWRGVAAYQAGNYQQAIQALRHAPGSDGAYNLGNALAKTGHFMDAMKAYDRALKLDPSNQDARVNRDVLKALMRKQKQHAQSSSNSGKQSSHRQGKGGKPQQGKSQRGKPQQGKSQQGKSQQGKSQQGKSQQGKSQRGKPQQGKSQQGKSQQGKSQQGKSQQGKPQQGKPQQGKSQQGKSQQGKSQQGKSSIDTDHLTKRTSDRRQSNDTSLPAQRSGTADRAKNKKLEAAFKKEMDKSLTRRDKVRPRMKKPAESVYQLGRDDGTTNLSKLPAPIRQALHQVRDDPGALLRRKFELEYRERLNHAAPADGE